MEKHTHVRLDVTVYLSRFRNDDFVGNSHFCPFSMAGLWVLRLVHFDLMRQGKVNTPATRRVDDIIAKPPGTIPPTHRSKARTTTASLLQWTQFLKGSGQRSPIRAKWRSLHHHAMHRSALAHYQVSCNSPRILHPDPLVGRSCLRSFKAGRL